LDYTRKHYSVVNSHGILSPLSLPLDYPGDAFNIYHIDNAGARGYSMGMSFEEKFIKFHEEHDTNTPENLHCMFNEVKPSQFLATFREIMAKDFAEQTGDLHFSMANFIVSRDHNCKAVYPPTEYTRIHDAEAIAEWMKIQKTDKNVARYIAPCLVVGESENARLAVFEPEGCDGDYDWYDYADDPNKMNDIDSMRAVNFASYGGFCGCQTSADFADNCGRLTPKERQAIRQGMIGTHLRFLEKKDKVRTLASTLATVALKKKNTQIGD